MTTDLIEVPTEPRGNEEEIQAQREYQKTGLVPMEYVQSVLRKGLSNGQTIIEIVTESLSGVASNFNK